MTNNPEIIGLDLSLTSTGIATPQGTYVVSSKAKGDERIDYIVSQVLMEASLFRPAYFVIEGYAFAKRTSYVFAQGELGGVVKRELRLQGIPFVLVPPTVRAKFATGRGNAGKSEVVSSISAKLGKVFSGGGADDEVDAWVLREMGLQHFGLSKLKWPAKNMEALEKVEWVEP